MLWGLIAALISHVVAVSGRGTCGHKLKNMMYDISPPYPYFIHDGTEAYPHEWPWTLMLNADTKECGAILVQACDRLMETDIALTAAHCVLRYNNTTQRTEQIPLDSLYVIPGVHDWRDPVRPSLQLQRVITHARYILNANGLYDIALIKFSPPLKFTKWVSPICFPWGKTHAPNRRIEQCYAAGWGFVRDPPRDPSHIGFALRHARHDVKPDDYCEKIYAEITEGPQAWHREYVRTTFCTVPRNDGQFLQRGDSGGPFMCKDGRTKQWLLYGISHRTHQLFGVNALNTQTSILAYTSWIKSGIQQHSSLCQRCSRNKTCEWTLFRP